jgi:DNA-binding NarL/FixJ family response regulator
MIRIVVAEDHHVVRQGICKLLEEAGDMQVVGEADSGRNAIDLVRSVQPDVLVLDIRMPQLNGLETLADIQRHKKPPRVVILSMYDDPGFVQQALAKGALGYVLKQSVGEELLAAIRAAEHGSVYLSAEVAPVLARALCTPPPQTPLDRLSPREREVVSHIVAGCSTKEIAYRFHTSVKTVEKQRRDAMRKLDVDNVASLVRVSLDLGLVPGRAGKTSDG